MRGLRVIHGFAYPPAGALIAISPDYHISSILEGHALRRV